MHMHTHTPHVHSHTCVCTLSFPSLSLSPSLTHASICTLAHTCLHIHGCRWSETSWGCGDPTLVTFRSKGRVCCHLFQAYIFLRRCLLCPYLTLRRAVGLTSLPSHVELSKEYSKDHHLCLALGFSLRGLSETPRVLTELGQTPQGRLCLQQ